MQNAKEFCPSTSMQRIFSNCQYHTVTGRLVLGEPSVQNVPKEFEMLLSAETGERDCTRRSETSNKELTRSVSISMRTAFVPFKNGVFISADYSQLELRIITHLSQDNRLMEILNNGGDVFRMIAAEINQCDAAMVTSTQRQCTKHICYGIIYGIGARSLGEKLKIGEEEAGVFMDAFKNRFKGIKDFVKKTIEFARGKGYVLTLNNRRRYLSMINAKGIHMRGQAERQAVNTTVQGSAADLVKMAMVNIDACIDKQFGTAAINKHSRTRILKPRLVLHMHDELIYECHLSDKNQLARIVKTEMEQAVRLVVPLPVNVKIGKNWGELADWKP